MRRRRAWLAFLAAWDRRRSTRFERVLVVATLVAGVLALVPGLAVSDSFTERNVAWAGITYSRTTAKQVVRAAIAQVTTSSGIPTAQVELISAPADELECDEILLTGTGLGLALVKRIAEAHGGTVEYEPVAVGGASFVLRVPLRERQRDDRATAQTGAGPGP